MEARETDGQWSVVDLDGGVWWADSDADQEINDSANPEATAIRICEEEPTRGEWHD